MMINSMSGREVIKLAGLLGDSELAKPGTVINLPMLRRKCPSSSERLPAVRPDSWQQFHADRSIQEKVTLKKNLSKMNLRGGKVMDVSPMYGRVSDAGRADYPAAAFGRLFGDPIRENGRIDHFYLVR